MARELPRVLRSLSPALQIGIEDHEYEIIVIDNGSRFPPTLEKLRTTGAPVRELRLVRDAKVSPSEAINEGLRIARAELIGVFIDGARIASPGLLVHALLASRLSERAVVSPIAYHLGPTLQNESVAAGYDQAAEDELLRSIDWENDPYRLFEISVPAGSCSDGCFAPLAESNALFMRRQLWAELGGYEQAFRSRGGGLANLDTYRRACELPGALVITLFGEATFHQVHGGVATNAVVDPWPEFHREYVELRGLDFTRPATDAIFLGRVPPQVLGHLERSVRSLSNRNPDPAAGRADHSTHDRTASDGSVSWPSLPRVAEP